MDNGFTRPTDLDRCKAADPRCWGARKPAQPPALAGDRRGRGARKKSQPELRSPSSACAATAAEPLRAVANPPFFPGGGGTTQTETNDVICELQFLLRKFQLKRRKGSKLGRSGYDVTHLAKGKSDVDDSRTPPNLEPWIRHLLDHRGRIASQRHAWVHGRGLGEAFRRLRDAVARQPPRSGQFRN